MTYRTLHLWLMAFCLLWVLPLAAQDDDLREGVTINTPAASEDYILFSLLNAQTAYLIDKEGQLINQWQSDFPVVAPYLRENGNLIAAVFVPQLSAGFPIGGTGRVEEYDWDGNLVWSFEYASDDYLMHHDIEPLPNGNVLLLAYERVPVQRQRELGITPRADEADLLYDMLLEVERETGDIIWQWRVTDHLVQDEYPDVPTYGIPADFPQRFDPNYHLRASIAERLADRTHFNSIDYHPERDQVMISMWYTSEIWIIDRKTDALAYRWGNPAAFNRGIPEQQQIFSQHDPRWLPDGNILIFNNGSRLLRQFSTVIEIEPPLNPDGTYRLMGDSAYEPLDPVWEYRADPPESFFAGSVSGAQRLSNGNILVTDGPAARIFEITRDGEIVWQFEADLVNLTRGLMARIFKAQHYPPASVPGG